eukprot:UN18968
MFLKSIENFLEAFEPLKNKFQLKTRGFVRRFQALP